MKNLYRPVHFSTCLVLWAAFVILSRPCYADVMYSYQSNALNPLYNAALPIGASPPDSIDISFTLPAPLAADSTYNISVSTSSNYVDTWKATDTLFGVVVTGVDAPILLVPSPGLIAGGALTFCDSSGSPYCFGGAIVTNNLGNIVQWNLLADDALAGFVTYNNSYIGSIDDLGYSDEFELNQLNGPTGVWVETSSTSIPEPASLAVLLPALAGLGFAIRARSGPPHSTTTKSSSSWRWTDSAHWPMWARRDSTRARTK